MKVVFVGCNPSLKNDDPKIPFKGTRSGKILESWREILELEQSQCSFINLTKYATKNQSKLKKKDVDLRQFQFELAIKLVNAYHDENTAFSMIVSHMQNKGSLDTSKIVPNDPTVMEQHVKELREMSLPKIIALGQMAAWGMDTTGLPFHKLPHPSGLNRKLNDPEYVAKVLAECRNWLYNLPHG